MKSFEEFQTEDRRLVILHALQNAAQYTANALLVKHYCDAVGHAVSSDRIAQDLTWLAEQGLVTIKSADKLIVATLTSRGSDVADARVTVPGVKRPEPGL